MYPKTQVGFGLPSALFLITVLLLIVAAMNQLNESNAVAYGREWLSMRAFYAAESGAQTAATYALHSSSSLPTCDGDLFDGTSMSLALHTCGFTVACNLQNVDGVNFITLTSTGQCGSGADRATRVIQVRLRQE